MKFCSKVFGIMLFLGTAYAGKMILTYHSEIDDFPRHRPQMSDEGGDYLIKRPCVHKHY